MEGHENQVGKFDWTDDKWSEDPYYCPCCFENDSKSLRQAIEVIKEELEHCQLMLDRLDTFNEVIANASPKKAEQEALEALLPPGTQDQAEEQAGSPPDEGRLSPLSEDVEDSTPLESINEFRATNSEVR